MSEHMALLSSSLSTSTSTSPHAGTVPALCCGGAAVSITPRAVGNGVFSGVQVQPGILGVLRGQRAAPQNDGGEGIARIAMIASIARIFFAAQNLDLFA
ncbi:MAG: hypothetical protein LAP21_13625 [Acidobacteriia bacterium]|nr:hypothetical protein [Terriglobia bacterium]